VTKQELADKYNISTIGQAHKVLFDLYIEIRDMLCGKDGFSAAACEKYQGLKDEYISLYSILDTHPHTSQKHRDEMRRQWRVLRYS
jgi:hypothetical protein